MKFIIGHRHRYYYLNRYNDELMYVSDGEYSVLWTDDLELVPNYNYDGWDVLIEEGKGQNYIFFFRQSLATYIPSGFDFSGKIITPNKVELNNSLIRINVSNIIEGIYLLHIITDKEVNKVKVVIER